MVRKQYLWHIKNAHILARQAGLGPLSARPAAFVLAQANGYDSPCAFGRRRRQVGSPAGRNAAAFLFPFLNHPFSRYQAIVSRSVSSTGRKRIPSTCSVLRWSKRVRSRSRAINRTVARLISAGRPLTRAQTSFAAPIA